MVGIPDPDVVNSCCGIDATGWPQRPLHNRAELIKV